MKAVKAQRKIWKTKKRDKNYLIQLRLLIISPLVYRKIFTKEYDYPTWYIFLGWALWADSVSPPMNTIASRDQLKPIRVGETKQTVITSIGCPEIVHSILYKFGSRSQALGLSPGRWQCAAFFSKTLHSRSACLSPSKCINLFRRIYTYLIEDEEIYQHPVQEKVEILVRNRFELPPSW